MIIVKWNDQKNQKNETKQEGNHCFLFEIEMIEMIPLRDSDSDEENPKKRLKNNSEPTDSDTTQSENCESDTDSE